MPSSFRERRLPRRVRRINERGHIASGRAFCTNRFSRSTTSCFRSSPFDEIVTTPNQLRWDPLPMPTEPTDFIDGITTIAGNGDSFSQTGMAVHIYACNKGMGDRYFYNADGEMLIVPEMGRLGFLTELGAIAGRAGLDRRHSARVEIPRRARTGRRSSAAAISAKTTASSFGCPISGRSARTAWRIRAILKRRSRGTKTATASARSSQNSAAICGRARSIIRRSMSSPGTATTRRTDTICGDSTRSARSRSIIPIRRSLPC